MKVTIVIPSYNQQDYLEEAIVSALEQTKKCDVVVVDDGSTDDSLRIAKKYVPKIRLISQVNKGLASARNTGIMSAKGSYIFPLDADDIMMPTCIEWLVEIAKVTDADVVAPSFRTFGKAEQEVILMHDPKIEDFRTANRIGYFSLIKRAALLETGGYSPRMTKGYEDLHLWFDILSRGMKMVTTQQILMMYRTKDQSMWHDSVKHHDELMAQIYKDFPMARI